MSQRGCIRAAGGVTTVVRFGLSGDPSPPATETLHWGNLARAAAMSWYGRLNGGDMSPVLSGKDGAGRPLRGHRHAFYLPTDEDGDGRLDHLTVWVPGGLGEPELEALRSMDTLNPGDSHGVARLSLQGRGGVDNFEGVLPLFGLSRRWRSLTPYVLTRHVKYRGKRGSERVIDGPEDQMQREVSLRFPEGPALVRVEITDHGRPMTPAVPGGVGFRPGLFHGYRGSGSRGGGAYNFVLDLEEPLAGPLALGFACHYGLGVFAPG